MAQRKPSKEAQHPLPNISGQALALLSTGDMVETDDGHLWLMRPDRALECIFCPTHARLLVMRGLLTPVIQIEIAGIPDSAAYFPLSQLSPMVGHA